MHSTTLYKRTFLLLGFPLGICRVLGFCPGVTGFYILDWEWGWRMELFEFQRRHFWPTSAHHATVQVAGVSFFTWWLGEFGSSCALLQTACTAVVITANPDADTCLLTGVSSYMCSNSCSNRFLVLVIAILVPTSVIWPPQHWPEILKYIKQF